MSKCFGKVCAKHPELLGERRERSRNCVLCARERSQKDRHTLMGKLRCLMHKARHRAKKAGMVFDLRIEDVLPAPKVCPVLGIKLEYAATEIGPGCATLDRLKNEVGYVRGNVMIISHRANLLKRDATHDELQRVANYASAGELI